MSVFAIIGAGNAGCAFAAHLRHLGHETRLYDSQRAQLEDLRRSGGQLVLSGDLPVSGPVVVNLLADDLATLVEGADLILCTTPAHCHRDVARELAPHLTAGQIVMLNPGRTCGALEVRQTLREHGAPDGVVVVEAQTLLYACRRQGTEIHVYGCKERVACAALPGKGLDDFLRLLSPTLPQFVAADQGIWQTSLDNIGMLFHPAPTLMNLARMESGDGFDYYHEGMTPTVVQLVEQLDAERCAVAAAMGIRVLSAREWLRDSYGASGDSLYEAIHSNRAYAGIRAPRLEGLKAKKSLRYVAEDVPTGLVPVSQLGERFSVVTPAMNLVIDLASTLWETDFRASGRNLERLGLSAATREEILSI